MLSRLLCSKLLTHKRSLLYVFPLENRFIFRRSDLNGTTFEYLFNTSRLIHSSGLHQEIAISSPNSSNQDSLAVSYLINSCGLSPEAAISVSKKVQFKTLEGPNSVLALLRNHGFTKSQVAQFVKVKPSFLLSDPEKTLLPKLQFLLSVGFSNSDLARTLTSNPEILFRSLEKHIIPNYNILKTVLRSDEKIFAAMRNARWAFQSDYTTFLVPKIAFLREHGVPDSCIALLLTNHPQAMTRRYDQFSEALVEVKEMGFDPSKSVFVLAVHALLKRGIWNRCYQAYGKWGWSKNDILLAFQKHPQCMNLSEKKIFEVMDFLVNKMGWQSTAIARSSSGILFSLEKRIIPRCSVIKVLSLKGLTKKNVSLLTVLQAPEKSFLKHFVTKYEEKDALVKRLRLQMREDEEVFRGEEQAE
ncbi:hypothetical protein RJ639_000440 [Escallonia herrerae]|uniref:Uncharacterized protein n=1 Tax=Escallonia herrerae TaxID=1293975 RepID=A0AA88X7R4_9ASTE|nr:hypothetical protein RJ639_000440 [Escallonia herrerae]